MAIQKRFSSDQRSPACAFPAQDTAASAYRLEAAPPKCATCADNESNDVILEANSTTLMRESVTF